MKLLDQVRMAMRRKHDSPRTEEAYTAWIVRYARFRVPRAQAQPRHRWYSPESRRRRGPRGEEPGG